MSSASAASCWTRRSPIGIWFPAAVYAAGELAEATAQLAPDLPVLVAEPVVWEVEYRLFVLERAIAALSPYLRGGELARQGDAWPAEPGEIEDATAFAQAMLADPEVALPAAVVVDVGRIHDRGWAAWASGLCGADPLSVLDVLRRASVPRDRLSHADMPWIRAT
jgi:hypothetical protein